MSDFGANLWFQSCEALSTCIQVFLKTKLFLCILAFHTQYFKDYLIYLGDHVVKHAETTL